MPIAGVVIVTTKEDSMQVLDRLKTMDNITTYGIHKDNNIVAVFEADSPKGLEGLSKQIQDDIPGVLGIYPNYVNYEDEE